MSPMRVLTDESTFQDEVDDWGWILLETRWYEDDFKDLKIEVYLTSQGKLIEVRYKRNDPENDPPAPRSVFFVKEIFEMEVWI